MKLYIPVQQSTIVADYFDITVVEGDSPIKNGKPLWIKSVI